MKSPKYKSFKTLREIRKSKSIKQKDLAEKVGITREYLCYIETHKRMPSIKTIKKIAECLEISLARVIRSLQIK